MCLHHFQPSSFAGKSRGKNRSGVTQGITFHSQGQLERRNLRANYVKAKELMKKPEELVIIFEIDSAVCIYIYIYMYTHVCVTVFKGIYIYLFVHVCTGCIYI